MNTLLKCGTPAGCEVAAKEQGFPAKYFPRLLQEEHGGYLVEASVSWIVLVLMILGIMEFCMMGYNYSVAVESAREGVRYASIHGTDNTTSCSGPSTGCDSTGSGVSADVKAYAATFSGNFSGMTVNVSYPDGKSTGTSRVQVTVSQPYHSVFYYMGYAPTISASSSGRILY